VIFKRKHNWLMCWLYTGTFGSFIGFSAAFPLLTKTPSRRQRPADRLPRAAGRRARPRRHRLGADKFGGARVTFWVFVGMMAALACLLHWPQGSANFAGFFAMFIFCSSHRGRQCLHLPDDPGDHAQGSAAPDARS
jgi:NNP family nitrate/nitrite transporter-like MFS transporter